MKVTVFIPESILTTIETRFKALTNRGMTTNELEAFLEEDIVAIYAEEVHNGLDDALSTMFARDVYGRRVQA